MRLTSVLRSLSVAAGYSIKLVSFPPSVALKWLSIVFTPGEKVSSFGHPSVETIIERFLMRAPPQNPSTIQSQFIEAQRNDKICELNAQLALVNSQLEAEKKSGDDLNCVRKATMAQFWWASPVEDLNSAQLDQMKAALEELKKSVTHNANKLLIIQGNLADPAQLFGASSSNDVLHHLQHVPPAPAPAPALVPAVVPQGISTNMLQPVMHRQNPMTQNHLFNGNMMQHHAFNPNNMEGYGPNAEFF